MAATESYGQGNWGCTAQTGIITHNVDYTYTSDKKTLKNEVGNDFGVTYYNARVDVTIDGAVPQETPFSGKVGTALSLSNALADMAFQNVTGGTVLVDEINRKKVNEDYETISVKATVYPYIT